MRASLILLVAATFIGCDATPTAPKPRPTAPSKRTADVIQNDRVESVSSTVNACDGAPIDLHLTFHNVFAITLDAAGGQHVTFHQNLEGDGINTVTGVQYVFTGTATDRINVRVGSEQTFILHYHVVSQGPGDNLVLSEDFHLTFTPNGDITSSHDNFEVECRG